MTDQQMQIEISGYTLAKAFSSKHGPAALIAGNVVSRQLAPRQLAKQFVVQAEGQSVLIPERLNFVSDDLQLTESEDAWLLARALQTRSNDGFQRQRAARDLLTDLQPWAAPFIVSLIGEYIVEILDDVAAALTHESTQTLGTFISHNQAYWNTTKRRVMSYWNEYYRWQGAQSGGAHRRDQYVGFKLIAELETAASERTQSPT